MAGPSKKLVTTPDAKRNARAVSAENMRRQCGLAPKSPKALSLGQRLMAKALSSSGNAAERAAARAKLAGTR